jgi:hypothetical protein
MVKLGGRFGGKAERLFGRFDVSSLAAPGEFNEHDRLEAYKGS